jgi:hypothetical protein
MGQVKAQQPAQGISLAGDYGKSKSFRVECDCGTSEHAVNMWIEVNKEDDIPDVIVNFYVDTWTPLWDSWRDRLKAAYDILFKGVHKQQHEMLLNKQAAVNFAHAILDNIKEMEKQNGNTTKRSQ